MLVSFIFHSFLAVAASAPSPDFSVTVSIVKEGEDAKGGSIEFKNGKCTTTNGPNARSQASKVCKEIGERIAKDESTYTVLPWINSPHVPSFIVVYRSEKSSWTRETGVSPDRESKTREALRALAVKVLETAK
jgi:hypothetical protein